MKHNHIVAVMQLLLTIIVSATVLFKLFNGVIDVHQCEAADEGLAVMRAFGDQNTYLSSGSALVSFSGDQYCVVFKNPPVSKYIHYTLFFIGERSVHVEFPYAGPIDFTYDYSGTDSYFCGFGSSLDLAWHTFYARVNSESTSTHVCFKRPTIYMTVKQEWFSTYSEMMEHAQIVEKGYNGVFNTTVLSNNTIII